LIFGEFFGRKGNIPKKNILLKNIHLAKWQEFATKNWCLVFFEGIFFI
jgi:hypothetical protein